MKTLLHNITVTIRNWYVDVYNYVVEIKNKDPHRREPLSDIDRYNADVEGYNTRIEQKNMEQ